LLNGRPVGGGFEQGFEQGTIGVAYSKSSKGIFVGFPATDGRDSRIAIRSIKNNYQALDVYRVLNPADSSDAALIAAFILMYPTVMREAERSLEFTGINDEPEKA
jgi:hypothetical protein